MLTGTASIRMRLGIPTKPISGHKQEVPCVLAVLVFNIATGTTTKGVKYVRKKFAPVVKS